VVLGRGDEGDTTGVPRPVLTPLAVVVEEEVEVEVEERVPVTVTLAGCEKTGMRDTSVA